jgi:predicted metalloprotease
LLLFRYFGFKGVLIGAVVLCGLSLFVGADGPGLSGDSRGSAGPEGLNDSGKAFVSFVLDDVQNEWKRIAAEAGQVYRPARLVLFTGQTPSACGLGQSATGPFYCPRDQKVYIDLGFYRALRERLGAPGDFAQAYVIAHEIGHHLSHLQGTLDQGRDEGAGGGSVRVELQADCYAGVWAHGAKQRGLLEVGDLEEAMRAAEAIGDDTLQRQAGGTVRPETFSHGTSAQRMRWFRRGFDSGAPSSCNTLEVPAGAL